MKGIIATATLAGLVFSQEIIKEMPDQDIIVDGKSSSYQESDFIPHADV